MYEVNIVGVGKGVVYPGDPAYEICQSLSQLGFSELYMRRDTFLGGRLVRGTGTTSITDQAVDDQEYHLSEIDHGVCRHHWVLETPTVGVKTVLGTCKICHELKEFPVHGSIELDTEPDEETPWVRAYRWNGKIVAQGELYPFWGDE